MCSEEIKLPYGVTAYRKEKAFRALDVVTGFCVGIFIYWLLSHT